MKHEEPEYYCRSYEEDGEPIAQYKNKFARVGLGLSILGLFTFPIFIFQILGMFFSIKGLKSYGKGLAIAGIIISCLAMLMGICLAHELYYGNSVLENQRQKADKRTAAFLETEIDDYVVDTDDKDLVHFGYKPSVKSIIKKLNSKMEINGAIYGPYLNKSSVKTRSRKYKGFEIVYDRRTLDVSVFPSETGDSFIINN